MYQSIILGPLLLLLLIIIIIIIIISCRPLEEVRLLAELRQAFQRATFVFILQQPLEL